MRNRRRHRSAIAVVIARAGRRAQSFAAALLRRLAVHRARVPSPGLRLLRLGWRLEPRLADTAPGAPLARLAARIALRLSLRSLPYAASRAHRDTSQHTTGRPRATLRRRTQGAASAPRASRTPGLTSAIGGRPTPAIATRAPAASRRRSAVPATLLRLASLAPLASGAPAGRRWRSPAVPERGPDAPRHARSESAVPPVALRRVAAIGSSGAPRAAIVGEPEVRRIVYEQSGIAPGAATAGDAPRTGRARPGRTPVRGVPAIERVIRSLLPHLGRRRLVATLRHAYEAVTPWRLTSAGAPPTAAKRLARRLASRTERVPVVARTPASTPASRDSGAVHAPLASVPPARRDVLAPARPAQSRRRERARGARRADGATATRMPAIAPPSPAASPPAVDIARLTDQVVRAIDRRIVAHRERLGG